MSDKRAFVFDTNFIIQNSDLKEVVANLSDQFSVYVTQVSIDERIAQQCRDIKSRFDSLEKAKSENRDIAEIKFKNTYESYSNIRKRIVQENYNKLFGDNIIPFNKDVKMLEVILQRANDKKAPFSNVEGASDKGFKDSLIWMSILQFFIEKGEGEVVFVTDDNGFTKNQQVLTAEFKTMTKKTIIFRNNSYYKELLKPELIPKLPANPIPANIDELRDKIELAAKELCYSVDYDQWGEEYPVSTFTINKKVDAEYMVVVFSSLDRIIRDNIFEKQLPASLVLDLDKRITDTGYKIPIHAITNIAHLHDEIKKSLPEYYLQFCSTIANTVNQNYKEQKISQFIQMEEEELPF